MTPLKFRVNKNSLLCISVGGRWSEIGATTAITLRTTDAGSGVKSQLYYQAIGGNGYDVFTVAASGEIILSKSLDAKDRWKVYDLTVRMV